MQHKLSTTYFQIGILVLFLFLGIYLNYWIHHQDLKNNIFGGDGDGYFNLWLLENTRLFFQNFNLNHFINTSIFYPENQGVLFWSDNLIIPGILYSILYYFNQDIFLSYNLLTYIAIIASYFTYYLFFYTIIKTIIEEKFKNQLTPKDNWFFFFVVLLFTYNVSFSVIRLIYTAHFQNQWSFLVILGGYGCLLFLNKKHKIGIAIISCVYLTLCYTAMYYAVGFAALVLLFTLYYWTSNDLKSILLIIKKYWSFPLCTAALSLPILKGYASVMHRDTSQMLYTSKFRDFYNPVKGSFLYGYLHNKGIHIQPHTDESHIYIGYAVFLLSAYIFIFYLVYVFKYIFEKKNILKLFGILFLFHLIFWSLPNSFYLKSFLTTSIVAVTLFYFIFYISKAVHDMRMSYVLGFLFIALLLFYGISFGYSGAFYKDYFNPSVYGVLSILIPGMRSMRAIGRFGGLGTVFLYGIILYFFVSNIIFSFKENKIKLYSTLSFVFLALMSLNLIEQKINPYVAQLDSSLLIAKPDEKDFLTKLSGNAMVFPIVPDYASTYCMIYFLPFNQIKLVNGYSGRSSLFFTDIVKYYSENIPKQSFVDLLQKKNVSFLVFQKWRYSENDIKNILLRFSNVLFHNDRFLVVKI